MGRRGGAWVLSLLLLGAVALGALAGWQPSLLLAFVPAGLLAAALWLGVLVARRTWGPAAPWESFLLLSFWALTINVPILDPSGATNDQGLFSNQSLARLALFAVGFALALVFWLLWGRQRPQRATALAPAGATLLFSLYAWYLAQAPLVTAGVSLGLAVFGVLEWLVAFGLLCLLFHLQNTRGRTTLEDRLRLLMPMLFFVFSVTLALLLVRPSWAFEESSISGIYRLRNPFTEPNMLAIVAVVLFAYALAFWSGWRRPLLIAACVLMLGFTYSRAGYAAFGLVLIAASIILSRHAGLQLIVCLLLAVGAILVKQSPGATDQIERFLSRGSDPEALTTLSERTAVWEGTKILISRSPWLGEGFFVGPKAIAEIMIRNKLKDDFGARHAHNELLQAQASGGVMATLLSLAIQLRIVFLLAFRVPLSPRASFFMWSLWLTLLTWSFLQPSLSYFLSLPGVILGWQLLTLEGLPRPRKHNIAGVGAGPVVSRG